MCKNRNICLIASIDFFVKSQSCLVMKHTKLECKCLQAVEQLVKEIYSHVRIHQYKVSQEELMYYHICDFTEYKLLWQEVLSLLIFTIWVTFLQGYRTTPVQFVSTRTPAVSNFRGWWRIVLDIHPHPHTQDKLAAFPPHWVYLGQLRFFISISSSIAVASAILKANGTYRAVGVSVCLDADCSAWLDEQKQ